MTSHIGHSTQAAWKRLDGHDDDESRGQEFREEDIIRRAQQGDGTAFEHLYRSNSRRIFGLCLRMVGNASEAEDLTQEAFLMAFRKIRTFRGESAFTTWLYRLSFNVVLMYLRKKKLRCAVLERALRENEGNSGEENASGAADTSLIGLIDRFHLERAVDQLPATCKMVLVLHDIHGFKHHEIAGMMDLSVGTSKGRLHRARARLRELLRESLNRFPASNEAAGPTSQLQPGY